MRPGTATTGAVTIGGKHPVASDAGSGYNRPRFPSSTAARIARMLAKLNTFALVGIDAVPVFAEVDTAVGLPKTVLLRTR